MIQQDEPTQRAFQKFEALGADYVRTKLEMGAYEDAEQGLAEQWLATQSAGAAAPRLDEATSGGKLKWVLMVVLLLAGGLYAMAELGVVKLPQKLPFTLPF